MVVQFNLGHQYRCEDLALSRETLLTGDLAELFMRVDLV
jgi:hypothetical protein